MAIFYSYDPTYRTRILLEFAHGPSQSREAPVVDRAFPAWIFDPAQVALRLFELPLDPVPLDRQRQLGGVAEAIDDRWRWQGRVSHGEVKARERVLAGRCDKGAQELHKPDLHARRCFAAFAEHSAR